MGLGIYVHIPYCIQRCPYCDFATFQRDTILPQEQYVEHLCREIQGHPVSSALPSSLTSIFFGGGTPSLLSPKQIERILQEIRSVGYDISPSTEVTIEINPGTLDADKMSQLRSAGINRFSVGAQTFTETRLKQIGREHSAEETIELAQYLADQKVNFSLDLLFALPNQTLEELDQDIDRILSFAPPHISPYCLTVGEKNPLRPNQPPEGTQIEMFELIEKRLTQKGYLGYEISNYAKPGFESQHNWLYWTDQSYLGFGLSAHSYDARRSHSAPFGARFWNTRKLDDYLQWTQNANYQPEAPWLARPPEQYEILSEAESKTDFCHTALRTSRGLTWDSFTERFGKVEVLHKPAEKAIQMGLLEIHAENSYRLTQQGRLKSNLVFELFHFL